LAGPNKRNDKFTLFLTAVSSAAGPGLQLTAENKVNRYDRRYVYYHCARLHRTPRCTQPSIEAKELERQLRDALQQILIPASNHKWALQQLELQKPIAPMKGDGNLGKCSA
jgi:site-specific DNA recombinase